MAALGREARPPSGGACGGHCLRKRDVIIHPDLTDLSVFGSKMDPTLQGQPAVLPASDRTNSGTRALVEGTTEGLQRLLDLPLETLRPMIDRFRASLTPREIGAGKPKFGNRVGPPAGGPPLRAGAAGALPARIRRVAVCTAGAELEPGSNCLLSPVHPPLPATTGVEMAGFGSHIFRRGRAVELFHGGADAQAVSYVHRVHAPLRDRGDPYGGPRCDDDRCRPARAPCGVVRQVGLRRCGQVRRSSWRCGCRWGPALSAASPTRLSASSARPSAGPTSGSRGAPGINAGGVLLG